MDIVKHNQVAWDNQSNQAESPWVKPVSRDEMAGADEFSFGCRAQHNGDDAP